MNSKVSKEANHLIEPKNKKGSKKTHILSSYNKKV